MPEVAMNNLELVGTGYAELPEGGRRYRFKIERYRDASGGEFGRVVDMQEVPDVGPYMWIPSYGLDASEATYMQEEWEYEQKNPDSLEQEWMQERRHRQSQRMTNYNEQRDERAKRVTAHQTVLTRRIK